MISAFVAPSWVLGHGITVLHMVKIKVDVQINKLRTENKNLHSYIEGLGQELDFHNSGGKLCELAGRHQRRKLNEVK